MAKILVVDDDPALSTVVVRQLEECGHKAVPCSDGDIALGMLDHEAFDLVLSDVHMPRMNGADLTLQIRALFPHLPILVMSGSLSDDPNLSLEFCRRLGATAALGKPFRRAELLAIVEDVLKAAPLRRTA